MPGDAAVMNVSTNGALGDERALGLDFARVAIGNVADRGRGGHQVRPSCVRSGAARARGSRGGRCRSRIERPVARAAEAGHAVLHVREEALARLLAVVADVDPGLDLRGDARRPSRPRRLAAARPASTGSPRLRRPCSSASARGRGRLPACVVRMRDVLVCTAPGSLRQRAGREVAGPPAREVGFTSRGIVITGELADRIQHHLARSQPAEFVSS